MTGISWRKALCAALLAALPGCGSCGAKLDELDQPRMLLQVNLGAEKDPKAPEFVMLDLVHEGECVDQASATAQVNGVVLYELDSGGTETNFWGYETCQSKSFMLEEGAHAPAMDGPVTATISDGDTTFEAHFIGLCDRRTLTLQSPSTPLRAGDRVQLEWQPATDIFEAGFVDLDSPDGRWHQRMEGESLQVEGNRISFTMPEVPDEQAGEVKIKYVPDNPYGFVWFAVPAAHCLGPALCLGHCDGTEPDPVTANATISGTSSVGGYSGVYPLEVASSLHYAVSSEDPAFDGSIALALADASAVCAGLMANTMPSNLRSLAFQLFNWDGAANQPLTLGEYQVGGEGSGARRFAEARFVTRESCEMTGMEEATGGTVKVTGYDASGKLEGTFSLSFGAETTTGRFVADSCVVPELPDPPTCQ